MSSDDKTPTFESNNQQVATPPSPSQSKKRQISPESTQSTKKIKVDSPTIPKQIPTTLQMLLPGCRSVDEYRKIGRISEGTYGIVYKAENKKTGEIVALKKIKIDPQVAKDGFPITSLRELNILMTLKHEHIVNVKEVLYGNYRSFFMAMEYCPHDLKNLMEKKMKTRFSQSEVKCLMLQLLDAIAFLHENWVIHRDLKTSNLLISSKGTLKVCDFGMARFYGDPIKPYTPLVITRWYRPPELLLGAKTYSTAVDMWSVGCIFAELLSKEPLFPGKTDLDQLDKIFSILGTPDETIWPGYEDLEMVKKFDFSKSKYVNKLRSKFPPVSFSDAPYLTSKGFDLLSRLLAYDPNQRISAREALNHEYFKESPLPQRPEMMRTFPDSNDARE